VPLPVFEITAPLRRAVTAGLRSRVLLKATTGSGKFTSVPGMLLDAGRHRHLLALCV
jgi:HrpA-like RNA helicase